jgi:hypothetical protein
MDKAPAYGAGDSGFEYLHGLIFSTPEPQTALPEIIIIIKFNMRKLSQAHG